MLLPMKLQGFGLSLPPRHGPETWTAEDLAGWVRPPPPPSFAPDTPAGRRAYAAMLRALEDPFQGCRSRPVMPPDQGTDTLEIAAAAAAIEDAGVSADEIGFVLQHSSGDRHLVPKNVFAAHRALGLRRECLVSNIDTENASFLTQLQLAAGLLMTGLGPAGLLIVSSQRAAMLPKASPFSALVGDGAVAVVVRADPSAGVVASVTRTEGAAHLDYVVSAEEAPWWRSGPIGLRVLNPAGMARHLLQNADLLIQACAETLDRAVWSPGDVELFVSHQPTGWMQEVVREGLGLDAAVTIDTFSDHGSLGACNLPLALALARRSGQAKDGARALLTAGGAANTWGAMALRL